MHHSNIGRPSLSIRFCLTWMLMILLFFQQCPSFGTDFEEETLPLELLEEKIAPVLKGKPVTSIPEEDRKYLFLAEQFFSGSHNLFFLHGKYLALELEDYSLAVPRLQKALEIEPQDTDSLELLAHCFKQMQQAADEVSCWDSLREMIENPDVPLPEPLVERTYDALNRMAAENDQIMIRKKRFIVYIPANSDWAYLEDDFTDDRLEDVYSQVTGDLKCIPPFRTSMIILTPEKFKEISPTSWAGGFACGGKSMVFPAPQESKSPQEPLPAKALCTHEFTHNIVYYLSPKHVPTWLNEGLAVFEQLKCDFSTDFSPNSNDLFKSEADLLTIKQLEELFGEIRDEEGSSRVAKAYRLAYLYVRFFIEHHTILAPMTIIIGCKNRPFDEVFKEITSWDIPTFEREFKKWARQNVFPTQ